mmetsp:Transcript_24860/g.35068  ORF Transcript_24860/g.35068 Transcript_24860/m.35068 type:complete len:609 (+) Transcript_24860:141-1967(+)
MSNFSVPFVAPNPASWGPPKQQDGDETASTASSSSAPTSKFDLLPYAPFGRSDRLGRAADFTSRGMSHQGQDRRGYRGTMARGNDDNQEFQYKVDAEEQSSFQLVDTSKSTSNQGRRFMTPAARRRQHATRLRQVNARRQNQDGPGSSKDRFSNANRRGGGGRGGGGRGGGYRRGGGNWQNRVDRQASVSVQADWKQVEELDLVKLTKNMAMAAASAGTVSTDAPSGVEDLLWCGFLDTYNDAYDKVTSRSPVPLKRVETKEFYTVTTTDDPILEDLAINGKGNVFCTDAILSHLMTCTRSVNPWDLVVQKLPSGMLFFDKRDNSQFDYLTVHETAHNPPSASNNDDPDGINTPERLGLEATMIHQNFTQQILKQKNTSDRKSFQYPNPFFDPDDSDGMEPASVAYRYRKFDLGNDIKLVCRTELHGKVKKNSQSYMTAFALNEYTPLPTSSSKDGQPTQTAASLANMISWREKIDSQRGAVLATELKNNSFKLAKWTAQSLLAGADQMKIGFVSRQTPKNAYDHCILATQFYRPKDFATQITLSEGTMWAMIRMFIQLLQKHPEGKYVLMRDPNKALLRLYSVPPKTFEDEDSDEEEEGDEGDKSEE